MGSIIEVIKGDTRSLDSGSYGCLSKFGSLFFGTPRSKDSSIWGLFGFFLGPQYIPRGPRLC